MRILSAQKNHVTRNSTLSIATMQYSNMNKNTIKKFNMSPDAIMQLAIQMAFYSLYNETVPTYESCSTAAFLKGRTECIRSATSATKQATLAILNGGTKNAKQLILNCSNMHGHLFLPSFTGQGFDRHILGLKITSERIGKETPLLFEDPGFLRMGHFVLSTSTLSTNTVVFGGFGPVVEDGFGIGYNVSSNEMGAVITSYKKHRNAKEFSEALWKSLDVLHSIMRDSFDSNLLKNHNFIVTSNYKLVKGKIK
ncbi:Choline/Carnitine O-acyltransferase [Dictyocaulus viviparus]|uniref:Choline/Carnitine O-acyltransferase n=1 Tax=Dictyocaulus viviparus TaxID=29172 RepID=A0A0D8YCE5_DICVI|nr:Choline/Carnitine O-acyltransferase [Dictyocaulus viviparus]